MFKCYSLLSNLRSFISFSFAFGMNDYVFMRYYNSKIDSLSKDGTNALCMLSGKQDIHSFAISEFVSLW